MNRTRRRTRYHVGCRGKASVFILALALTATDAHRTSFSHASPSTVTSNIEVLSSYCLEFEKSTFRNALDKDHYLKLPYKKIHPVSTATWALYNYQEYVKTNSDIFRDEFLSTAEALRRCLVPLELADRSEIGLVYYNFDWNYRESAIKKPWLSGMAQGMFISVMLRAYRVTSQPRYLQAAELAFNSLIKPSPVFGQLISSLGDEMWVQEYPPIHISGDRVAPSNVLNGGLIGAFGIYEYLAFTQSHDLQPIMGRIIRFLESHLKDYDLRDIGPSYGLLSLESSFHYLNLETDSSSGTDLLPFYEMKISTDQGTLLRTIRSTGGSADYDHKEFVESLEMDCFLSTDRLHEGGKIPVRSLKLVTSDYKTVGQARMGSGQFFHSWSEPYDLSGRIVRDYLQNGDGYRNADLMGRFIIRIEEAVPADKDLYMEIEYFDGNQDPVNVFLYTTNKYNVGFLMNRGSQTWKSEKFYIPRERDFDNYNLYLNFLAVEEYDGRIAQSLDFRKYEGKWSGNWIKWKCDDLKKDAFKKATNLIFDITYKDTSDKIVIFNMFNLANTIIGILNNTNSGRWKTERFTAPVEYFLKEGSHAEKTSTSLSVLRSLADRFRSPIIERFIETWKKSSIYLMDRIPFVLYIKDAPLEVPIRFKFLPKDLLDNSDRPVNFDVFIPGVSNPKWKNQNEGYKILKLNPCEFSYLNLPKDPSHVQYVLEVDYIDANAKGTLLISRRRSDTTETYLVGKIAFMGTGQMKKARFEIKDIF